MKKFFIITLFVSILLLFAPGHLTTGWAEAEDHTVPTSQQIPKGKDARQIVGKARIDTDFGNIPLYFIPNKGQMDKEALFCAKTSRYTLWLTKQGLVFDSIKKVKVKAEVEEEKQTTGKVLSPGIHSSMQSCNHAAMQNHSPTPHSPYSPKPVRDVSRLVFLNANPQPVLVPEKPTGHQVNYFKGKDKSRWRSRIPTSKAVIYKDLYQDIDLEVYGKERVIEYDWSVKPGGNPGNICFQYRQVKQTSIDEQRNLVVETTFGKWVHKKPTAYQEISMDQGPGRTDQRVEVAVQFKKVGKNTYGFAVGQYDKSRELIIDPMVLAYTTYLGGGDDDAIDGIDLDGSGAVYVVGHTWSADFPTANEYQSTLTGMADVLVSKFSPDGESLVFSTYLGGSDFDLGYGIKIGGGGEVYVTGVISSSDFSDFPVVNPYQSAPAGASDAFISKLSPDGAALLYSTYFGGSGADEAVDISVNSSDEIFIAGYTSSTDLPVQAPLQSNNAGSSDVFITRFSASGTSLVYSTYLGGSNYDSAKALDLDNNGAAYIGGQTYSTDFPMVNAYQSSKGSGSSSDGMVAKISPDGSTLVFSSYLGGSYEDTVYDVEVDNSENLHAAGFSGSNNFPTTPGTFQDTKPGANYEYDAFITKFAAAGTSLVYSTYLGGSGGHTEAYAIALRSGSAYVSGCTNCQNFPVVDEIYGAPWSATVAFASKLSADGASLEFSTTLGMGDSFGNAIAVDNSGAVYVAGLTSDSFGAYQGYQQVFGGGYYDAFLAKIVYSAIGNLTLTAPVGGENWMAGTVQNITWTAPSTIKNITIAYTTDDWWTYDIITESTPNTGTYSWTVPFTPSPDCKVGINDADMEGPPQEDSSPDFFTISPPPLTVISPNGSENWNAQGSYEIKWTVSGSVFEVDIDYSTDGGNNWTSIATFTANDGSHWWTVPNTPSSDCLVRVADSYGGEWDVSDAVFTIVPLPPPSITVTYPNGTESLSVGLNYYITWDCNIAVSSVSIDYSTDGGDSWIPIIGSYPSNLDYNWTVPSTPSTTCLVRVSDVSSTAADTSDDVFTIYTPTIPQSERDALIALYNSTNGDNWTQNTNWRKPGEPTEFNDPGTEDTWYGVTLTPDMLHVEDIFLASNNLVGAIPAEMNNLPYLTSFKVYSNQLSGSIPDLSGLTQLSELHLGGNNLSGSIPTWLDGLVNLTRLDLGTNQLSGTIPDLSSLTQLTSISIPNNNLTGGMPPWLNNLTNLNRIDLSNSQLSGTIPDLSNLTNLRNLFLFDNQLSGAIPPEFNNLVSLEVLWLGDNQLTGTIPDLSNLSQLRSVIFSQNQLSGGIPSWFNSLTNLEALSITWNNLTGTIPDLSGLNKLTDLRLSFNQLTGSVPTWLNSMTNLERVYLEYNQLTGGIPDLSGMTSLQQLYLYNNQLTGTIPPGLGSISTLERLFLDDNQLTGNIPAELGNLSSLQRLYLDDNQLEGNIPAEIGNLTNLNILRLNGNKLSGSIPGTLSNLTNLTNGTGLNLGWNGLYTSDTGLRDFLNTKQDGGDWESTQTIAPTGVTTGEITETSIKVSWTPITYQGDTGGYNVYYSTTSGSGYVLGGTTADKTVDNYTVAGLADNTVYYFVVEAFTDPHTDNQNTVTAEYSTEVSATTLEAKSITIITPNGTENWEGGTNQTITWSSIGAITDVKIEYSMDNGAGWNTVTASTPNSGSYPWTVPNTPSGQCLVKITDVAGSTTDTSDGVFTILEQRTVTVMTPNGAEEWFVGYGYDITWTSTGAVGTVAIDYSINNGGNWNSITSSTSNTGTYNWTVPNTPSTECLVRISDTAGPAVDISNGVFTISPRIPQAERDALIALYNSTNGDSWYTNSNWRKPGDPTQFNDPGTEHTWYGVTCNAEKNHVLEVNLYQNGLTGTIPDLSPLTELVTLNLGYNQLTGNIPASLNNLTQLTVLNLKINQLDGAIPDLSNLTNLVELYLSNNYFFSSIPTWLNNFTNLTVLHLQENSIYGTIPDLSNLTNLSDLNFSNNQLIGDIPAWLNNLTGLTELWLGGNSLSGVIPDLSNLTQLTHLSLGVNNLTGVIPASFNSLTNLQELYLSVNSLSGALPDLSNLTQLVIFSAMENDLTGSIDNITALTQLQWLYLNENQFSGGIPAALGNLTNLTNLHLDGNMLTGEIPGTLSNLTNLGSTNLELRWNGLYTGDPGLRDFLNSKQYGGDWESTQTIAPGGVSTGEETHNSVKVSWTPIQYQSESGGYRVYYSTTSGSDYQLAGTTNDKTVDNFTVNGLTAETTYYFVVESFTDPHNDNENTVTSEYSAEVSASTLEQPTLTITVPNGGQSWEATTSQVITWNSTGNITDVLIEYSTNSGGTWNTVIASTPNSGSYNWTVPNTPSGNCLVKITDIGGLAVDTSDAVFTIAEQRTITVTAPNGTESWEGGTSQNITWTSTGSIANVMIEYSTNNGGDWNTIVASTANSGTYNWTVPNTPSANCLVRITDTAGPATDTSNGVFTIAEQRTLTVTAPNGSENWEAGTTQTVTWTSTGSIANVQIIYSYNNGGVWYTVEASTPNDGNYNWTVPNTPSSNCLVRISDTAGPATDTSDGVFTIAEQRTLTVTAPNGSESWEAGTSQNITWNSTGSIANVMLEYSTNSGGSWNTITASTANSGTYNWTVPNTPSSNCLVRITDTAGPAVDTSDGVFTITELRTLTVTAPNGSENWEAGTTQIITWTSTGSIANVQIVYSTNNGGVWYSVEASTPNDGNYNWTVPNTPSSNCLVRISDTAGPATDTSNGVFTISEQRTLTVTAPNGSESWEGGTTQTITWNSTGGVANVMIEYSTNSGGSWSTVEASTTNDGNYNWTVPNTPSGNCLVRISDTAGPATDTSDGVFTILEQRILTVNAPNGAESWKASTSQTITWLSTGNIVNVKLEYSSNSGGSWNTIVSSTANSGSYNWTVPNDPSGNCLVKISDTAGPAWDESDAVFTITPPTISQTERDALIALYNSTDGDNWTNNTNWRKPGEPTQFNDPGTEQTWYGVTCDAGITHVTGINLSNNNLVGTMPAELNNLTQITTINLGLNQLTGSIPNLGSLTLLTSLNLQNNQLSGNIPASFNNLTGLISLYMPGNQLSGAIPDLSGLVNLSGLNLGANLLTGTIPAWINNLVNLTSLDLQDNQLTGTIPNLGSLTNLTSLNFDRNDLSGGIPAWINNCTQLTSLHMAYNQLSGAIPDISSLVQLTTINLSFNQLTGPIPTEIGTFTGMTSLRLNENQLQGSIPAGLGNLTALRYLYLDENQLGGSIPSEIGNLTALDYLYLRGNKLVGSLPGTLSNLTGLNSGGLELRWNGLYTADTGLRDFLNTKQSGGDWESTQTTAPEGVAAGNETFDSVNVSWTPIQYQANSGGYRVYYSTTSGSGYTLAGTTADKTVDNYTVTGLTPEQTYYFVVETVTDSHALNQNTVISEYSVEASATTLEERTLTITAPNGGQRWFIDSSYSITWTSTGAITSVMLEYSTNSGGSWTTIVSSTANSGSYNWTIPNTPSTNCLVRISDTAGPAVDVSNEVFTIDPFPTLTVQVPNGGQNWVEGSTETITWTYTGTIATVDIEYSANGGTSWNSIVSSTTNTGSYNWVIPAVESANCLVRVSDTATTASDTSDAVFTLWKQPSITVTAPNGGETWKRFSNQTITWDTTGNIQDVKIQYSQDAGANWIDVITSTPNDGSYQWNVPNVNKDKTQCLVKITTLDGTVVDTSDNYFTISKF